MSYAYDLADRPRPDGSRADAVWQARASTTVSTVQPYEEDNAGARPRTMALTVSDVVLVGVP